ncbi:MAG: hypothetical protein AAF798_02940 [Bacteroidota bacterium]
METLIFVTHLGISLYMFGLIWFVQVVHYPLFAKVDPARFVAYEQAHTSHTVWVTAPPMLLELGTALLWWWLAEGWVPLVNLVGVLGLWGSTFFIQVPLHGKLSEKHDDKAIQQLVRSNWIRTLLWSARAGLLLWYVFEQLQA